MELVRANCGHDKHDGLLRKHEWPWENVEVGTNFDNKEHNKITRIAEVDWAGASSCRKCGWEPVSMGFLSNHSTPLLEMMVGRRTVRRTEATVELHIYRTMRKHVTTLRWSYNERTRLIRTTGGNRFVR